MKRTNWKTWVPMALATATLAASLAGCASAPAEETKTLNMFMWTEYVPESVIAEFEKETGIEVNISYYSSGEEMYAKLLSENEGTFDIIQPTDYMVDKMVAQDMLTELDREKLPNFENLSEAYLNLSYDPGNVYSVPYMGGLIAIAVNRDVIDAEINGYADLFQESLEHQAVAADDTRVIIGVVAKALGYSMSTTDPDELAEIQEKMMELKKIVKVYDSDSPKSSLISGDCNIGITWNAEIALAMEENDALEIIFPEEGGYFFLDNWAIPQGAVNVEEAYQFINYMMDGEVSAACSEELPYLNPNEAAVELLGSEYMDNIAKNIPAEEVRKGSFIENLDVDTQAIYDAMWTKLKQ